MSDMYLVLRRRLEGVTEWVYFETSDLEDARKRLGLSYEGMARKVNVSSKTWERYEKAGRIPRHMVGNVAEVLRLEIEVAAAQPLTGRLAAVARDADDEVMDRLQALEQESRQNGELLREVARKLEVSLPLSPEEEAARAEEAKRQAVAWGEALASQPSKRARPQRDR